MSEPMEYGTGSNWLLVHSDPITGTQTYIQDMGDGNTAIRKVTPASQILDSAAADRSDNSGKRWGDGRVIGTVPLSLFFTTGYAEAKRNNDATWLRRFWNDRDNYKLRTFEGNI